jgi:linoleoyl-CoA desaturase
MGVMHDASHGSASTRSTINRLLRWTMPFVGVSSTNWHEKHVVNHHANTNIVGGDPDIESGGLFRFRDNEKWRFWHRLQHWYAVPAYSGLGLRWVWLDDFRDVLANTYKVRRAQLAAQWVEFVLSRVWHAFIFLVLPSLAVGSFWWVLPFYIAHWMIVGALMGLIFTLAHLVDGITFYETAADVPSDWAARQVATTADFAARSRLLTWAIGGLNLQTIHHLFPRMSHRRFRIAQPIVRSYCEEHGVTYREAPTMINAILSHFQHLKRLSRRPVPVAVPVAVPA